MEKTLVPTKPPHQDQVGGRDSKKCKVTPVQQGHPDFSLPGAATTEYRADAQVSMESKIRELQYCIISYTRAARQKEGQFGIIQFINSIPRADFVYRKC